MGTLAPHARQYLLERRKQGHLSSKTARKVSYCLADLDRSFGERPLTQFGPRAVERWVEQHENWSAATRQTYVSDVRGFTKWMLRRKVIRNDPFIDFQVPRPPKPVPRPIDRPNIALLLEACPDARARLIVMLMFSMGLRCIGVASLRVEDIDWVSDELVVREKFGDERRLPITPDVATAVARYLSEHPARTGPLVRSVKHPTEGIRAEYISTLVARWMRSAGVKHYALDGRGAHALRHTCLTEVADATGDAFVVAAIAGWTDMSMAAIYVRRASTERLREALAKRDEAV